MLYSSGGVAEVGWRHLITDRNESRVGKSRSLRPGNTETRFRVEFVSAADTIVDRLDPMNDASSWYVAMVLREPES